MYGKSTYTLRQFTSFFFFVEVPKLNRPRYYPFGWIFLSFFLFPFCIFFFFVKCIGGIFPMILISFNFLVCRIVQHIIHGNRFPNRTIQSSIFLSFFEQLFFSLSHCLSTSHTLVLSDDFYLIKVKSVRAFYLCIYKCYCNIYLNL